MPTYTANGLALHRLNLAENDKIITFFTREHGKLAAVAKGVRRATSRLSGATELFTHSRLLLATGKSLDVISQGEIQASFPSLRNDLERLARATYLCELVDRLTLERDASASVEIFDLTLAALSLLESATDYPDAIIHAYELRLLDILGYAPVLDRCVKCGEPLERRLIGFSPSLGGTLCNACRNRAQDVLALSNESLTLVQTLQLTDGDALLTLQPSSRVRTEVDRALRWFIRTRADRDLKSADFLDQLRAGHS